MIIKTKTSFKPDLIDRFCFFVVKHYKNRRINLVNKNISRLINKIQTLEEEMSELTLFKDILSSRLNRYRLEVDNYLTGRK